MIPTVPGATIRTITETEADTHLLVAINMAILPRAAALASVMSPKIADPIIMVPGKILTPAAILTDITSNITIKTIALALLPHPEEKAQKNWCRSIVIMSLVALLRPIRRTEANLVVVERVEGGIRIGEEIDGEIGSKAEVRSY